MATYKLIQDIEAEDHILGPLSLRQFIFALISVFSFYMCFFMLTHGLTFMLIIFLPPALFTGFFALPFGKDQPTEVWALAKIRFWFKPRKRVWDQSGVKELVTITVPKKIEHVLTNGLSQNEVQSRLHALASTIDSRGWAIKNVNVSSFAQPNPFMAITSDRLIDPRSLPQDVPNYEILASDDVLDEVNNPIAHQFEEMIIQSAKQHREQIVTQLGSPVGSTSTQASAATAPADFWFLNDSSSAGQTMPSGSVTGIAKAQDATADETAFLAQAKAHNIDKKEATSHLRTLQPIRDDQGSGQPQMAAQPQPLASSDPPVTPPADAAILALASNNDLNVSTLAREAHKAKHNDEPPNDEVVISLR